jgi:hypothetical protein
LSAKFNRLTITVFGSPESFFVWPSPIQKDLFITLTAASLLSLYICMHVCMYVCKLSEEPSVKVLHENKQEYQVCKIFAHLADYWILSHVKRQHFCEPLWSRQTGLCSQLVSPHFEGTARVTGLGEFSPIWWLFTFSSLCENYRYRTNNWTTFFLGKSRVHIFFHKKWVGLYCGRLFH